MESKEKDVKNEILLKLKKRKSHFTSKETENKHEREMKSGVSTQQKECTLQFIKINQEDVIGKQECGVEVKTFGNGEGFHSKEVGEKSCPSPTHQDHLRTDTDERTVKKEVTSNEEDGHSSNDVKNVKLEQVSELNKEIAALKSKEKEQCKIFIEIGKNDGNQAKQVIKMEKIKETGKPDDKPNGRDLIGTSENRDVKLEKFEEDDGTNSDDSETDLNGNEIDSDFNKTDLIAAPSQTGCRFRCQYSGCTSSFKHKGSLNLHQNIHTTKYQCRECRKCFKSSIELKRHLTVHSDERPFACDWVGCGGTFKLEDQMKQHRKLVHLYERSFHCNKKGCGKSFKTKQALQMHLKSHSSLRPFRCRVKRCGKEYKVERSLANHMKQVHLNFNAT